MSDHSSPVTSNQLVVHRNLSAVVKKHLAHPDRKPVATHTRQAFDDVRAQVEASDRPLIFDSFCGTGLSSKLLAERYPDSLVIGIDKSAHRLGRHGREAADNYLLVQAECGDFWRLAVEAGWRLLHHFLLYPNPWPKPGQLKRRVHGSPAFPGLLALGGQIELRSNWQVYIEEFGCALVLSGQFPCVDLVPEAPPLSLFERKYRESGHRLWRCQCELGHNSHPLAATNQTG